jgi:hypothetical protein
MTSTPIIDEHNQPIDESTTSSGAPALVRSGAPTPIRNRIKCHRKVRAADLVPHEWNFRVHPGNQRISLEALYRQVGFARSLLAYELPDGRLKLIDGHLPGRPRPDPAATPPAPDGSDAGRCPLEAAWHASVQDALAAPLKDDRPGYTSYPEQFLILVTCKDEEHQGELLTRFRKEG